jgi:hypothetical protein
MDILRTFSDALVRLLNPHDTRPLSELPSDVLGGDALRRWRELAPALHPSPAQDRWVGQMSGADRLALTDMDQQVSAAFWPAYANHEIRLFGIPAGEHSRVELTYGMTRFRAVRRIDWARDKITCSHGAIFHDVLVEGRLRRTGGGRPSGSAIQEAAAWALAALDKGAFDTKMKAAAAAAERYGIESAYNRPAKQRVYEEMFRQQKQLK